MFSKPFAYFLWLISGCGWLGFHRFYLRKPFTGILWMLTGGLGGFGSIYDLLTLGGQVDRANMEQVLFNRAGALGGYGAYGGTHYAEDAGARIIRGKADIERAALRVAKVNRGVVSAPELALEAGIEIDAAKKFLEEFAKKGHAEMRVRQNGTLVFIISEFAGDDDGYADI